MVIEIELEYEKTFLNGIVKIVQNDVNLNSFYGYLTDCSILNIFVP